MDNRKSLAIVGIGRWGKNLLREFSKIARVEICFHKGDSENQKWLKANYPRVKTVGSYGELLANPAIDAIAIATPIKTHFQLVYKALLASKHVFVEKPLAENTDQAKKLVALATKKKRILFVGYIFLYHPIFKKIKEVIKKEGARYVKMSWDKFGTFEEALGSNLLSHDLSIIFALFGKPKKIKVIGQYGFVTDCDMFSLRMYFGSGFVCDLSINRVSNVKNKSLTLVTSKNVYLWENDRLFKLDKRRLALNPIYKTDKTPLEIECQEFVNSITHKKEPRTDGSFGLEVVKLISKI